MGRPHYEPFPDPVPPAQPPAWSNAARAKGAKNDVVTSPKTEPEIPAAKEKPSVSVKISVSQTKASTQEQVEAAAKRQEIQKAQVQWKDYPKNTWPYPTPHKEFFMSPVRFSEAELRHRWEGLGFDEMIEPLFHNYNELERTRVSLRLQMRNGENDLDITDPDFQRKMNENSFVMFEVLKREQFAKIQGKVEQEKVPVYDETTGLATPEIQDRPMTANEQMMRYRIISDSEKSQRLIMGQSTEIVGHQNLDLTAQVAKNAAEKVKQLRSEIRGMKITTPELPALTPVDASSVEGEVIEEEGAE